MSKSSFYLFILLVLLLGSCSGERTAQEKFREKVGQGTANQIASFSQIAASKPLKQNKTYLMPSKRYILSNEEGQKLTSMLLDDQGYFFDKTKKCLFVPEIAFRFIGPDDEVDLMVNLFGNQMKIEQGNHSVILDYDPMAASFNALCREILEQMGD